MGPPKPKPSPTTLDVIKPSPEIMARVTRQALEEIECDFMIRIYGVAYYTGRHDCFDRLSRMGYCFDLITEQYFKPEELHQSGVCVMLPVEIAKVWVQLVRS
jgi:hypothetical protein